MQIRLNVNINTHTAAAIEDVARGKEVSKTEAVRQLIGAGQFVLTAVGEGKTVLLEDARGDLEKVSFLF